MGRDSGLIIVGLQRTRMDPLAAVKIWGRLDDILPKLAEELMRPGGGAGAPVSEPVLIPDPYLCSQGLRWMSLHPSCSGPSSMRAGFKPETQDQILKRSNPTAYKARSSK